MGDEAGGAVSLSRVVAGAWDGAALVSYPRLGVGA